MTLCFVFFVLSNEYEGYFDFFNLPIYTDRISELIQAKILKNPSLSLVKTSCHPLRRIITGCNKPQIYSQRIKEFAFKLTHKMHLYALS